MVYIDESGFAQDMPRTHGYSLKGKRCEGVHDWHARGRINAIGVLCGAALLTVSLFDCNIDSTVFEAWFEHQLLPVLPEKSVVVLDNAGFHKQDNLKNYCLPGGHTVEFLPPYSPDLNPIEQKWAQAKSIRRTRGCSVDELFFGGFL